MVARAEHLPLPLPPRAVVAVLRAPTAKNFVAACEVLRGAGITCFEFTLTTNPDGTLGFDGTIKFKGGTGAYKGARGSGETTGTQDADGYTTFEYNQKLKLPKKK